MSIQFYKIMHLTGIFMTLMALGALVSQVRISKSAEYPDKKIITITHGIGLLLALVGGFGLMARMGIQSWDGWLMTKIFLWFTAGALPVAVKKTASTMGIVWWFVTMFIGLIAVYMVNMKPF